MRTFYFYAFPLVFGLVGCLEQPGGTTQSAIPNITVECSQAQVVSLCRTSGDILWLGFTDELDLECGSTLSSFSDSTRNRYFKAYAANVSLSHSGYVSSASLSSWVDSNGASIGTLLNGTYKVCAFIESSSGNDRLDNDEPLAEVFVTVGGSSPELVNSWVSY